MDKLNVGIIGFGTVGSGTAELLAANAGIIRERTGLEIAVRTVADLDILRDRGVDLEGIRLTTEARDIISDPEIDVVVELIGGLEPARTFILDALNAGKHVVTANKALLAECGPELLRAAERRRVYLEFEASVGGGIPLIRAIREGLAANRIRRMIGIVNGTTNYILTQMAEKAVSYEQAVREAQALGFAEDPPTLDVEGTDAAHKLAVLLTLAYGRPVSFQAVYRQGITALTPEDIRFADEFGYRLKLLAVARDRGERGVEARVHPTMIPRDHILANVNGPFNAVYVEGDFVGPTLYYGQGAGRKPTASAVVSDLMEMARRLALSKSGYFPPLGPDFSARRDLRIQPMDDLETVYYIRFYALDRPGVLAGISGILARHGISIASVIQKGREVNGAVPIVMLTHEARESDVQKAVAEIERSAGVRPGTAVLIRVEAA